jgi:hypothetical protein
MEKLSVTSEQAEDLMALSQDLLRDIILCTSKCNCDNHSELLAELFLIFSETITSLSLLHRLYQAIWLGYSMKSIEVSLLSSNNSLFNKQIYTFEDLDSSLRDARINLSQLIHDNKHLSSK